MFLLLKYFQQLKHQTEPFAVGPRYIPRFLNKLREPRHVMSDMAL